MNVAAIFETFLARNVPGDGEVYLTFVDARPFLATPARNGVRLDLDERLVDRWGALTTGERGASDTAAGPIEYLAVPLQRDGRTAGVFVVANFVQDRRDQIDDGIRVEAAASVVVLIVALGAAWLLAGRLLRPIRQLTDTARSITETDLTARIPVETDDEIAELAVTFNAMLDRLDEAFATQRRFIDDAGHELRTPITIVRGHLEVMGDDPDERRETIALVTDELDRMARIVNDLLLLAKSEQPDFIRRVPVELHDLTTDLLVKARALGDRHWVLDNAAHGEIAADPDRLAQAVLNLARNAVEHTEPGDEIAIGSSAEPGRTLLWVRDTGPGVPEAERAHLFERFHRGRDRPRSTEGAGLGLAIVQSIAHGHDGTVGIDDPAGGGARFTISLPGPFPPPEVPTS
jgi:signal transduction histidine kinase